MPPPRPPSQHPGSGRRCPALHTRGRSEPALKQPMSQLNNCNGHTVFSWVSVKIPSCSFCLCVLDSAGGSSPIGGTAGVSGTKHGPEASSAPLGGPSCEAHTDISPGLAQGKVCCYVQTHMTYCKDSWKAQNFFTLIVTHTGLPHPGPSLGNLFLMEMSIFILTLYRFLLFVLICDLIQI